MPGPRRLRTTIAALVVLVPAVTVLASTTAQAEPAGTIGVGVTNLAAANVGRTACGPNTVGGTGFETSCKGNSGQPENWGADFVAWDWATEGINTTGLLTTSGGATPATFAKYGGPNGSVHSSPIYLPQPGDAVVYDSPADYVAIVTAVNADGSIQTTNGDWGGLGPGASNVANVILPSGQTAVGSAPDPMNGKTISAYVTPMPLANTSISLSPFGAVTWTPPGSSTSRTDILAADPHGVLWDYTHVTGTPSLLTTVSQAEAGWTHYREVGLADENQDHYPDIVAIDTTTNVLQVFLGSANGFAANPTQLGVGWSTNFTPMGIADYNHTGHPGVIAIERDTSTLWFYPRDLTDGVTTRTQIGSGWTSAFTPAGVADLTGDGHVDILTCRTDDKVAVLYPGDATGGGGASSWLTECDNGTFFGVTDYDGDGHPDLITRDNTTGVLSIAPSSLGSVGTVVATGSAATKALVPFGAITWTPPGSGASRVDVYAADASGNLGDYTETPSGLSSTPTAIETGWTHYRQVGVADENQDGYPDLVAIDTSNNLLDVFLGSATGFATTPTQVGAGWSTNFTPMGIADYNHTGHPAVIAIEHDTNTLWLYPRDLTDGITTRTQIGVGWAAGYTPFGAADFTGDGHSDLLTCRTDTTGAQLYPGDATGGTGSITQILTGCDKDTFFGATDYNGDGHPDLIARDNTTGDIVVVTGDGAGGWAQTSATTLATTW